MPQRPPIENMKFLTPRWGIFALLVGSLACYLVFGSGGSVAFLVIGAILGAALDALFWLPTFRRIGGTWLNTLKLGRAAKAE
jgi:hypothetical protein